MAFMVVLGFLKIILNKKFYFVQMLGLLDFHVILEKMEVLVLEKGLHQV